VSPIPGTEQTAEKLPADYQAYLDAKLKAPGAIVPTTNPTEDDHDDHEGHDHGDHKSVVPSHEHDSETEGGLIAVCVIVWIAVLILIIVFFYQYCKEKKGGSAIAYSVQ
jgi:hypothetical protein